METIAAIATAQGMGGIGVVRVSGVNAIKICNKIFRSITGVQDKIITAKGYTAHYGKIFDGEECLDDVIVTVFRQPHSYTGEDTVEISCHGGLYITKKVLSTVIKNGARLANAGEFTKRAFLNGKLGLTQAESVMDLISANGKSSAKAAIMVKEGMLYKSISKIKDRLIDLAAQLSVWADYPDEDVISLNDDIVKKSLMSCIDDLKKLLSTYHLGKVIREGVNTVIVGRPNVGKSTLMNLLAGYDRSIVTDVPGTTRDVVEQVVSIGDICLNISDTAGIRSTSDKVEEIGVERAKKQLASADLVLAVFNGSEKLNSDDEKIIELVRNQNVIAVINKIDLVKKIDLSYLKTHLKNVIEISAKNGTGFEVLTSSVSDMMGLSKIDPYEAILATERQKVSAKNSLDCLMEAFEILKEGFTLDAITVLVEDAIEFLLELTGERVSDEVVDRVFSKFCVGK